MAKNSRTGNGDVKEDVQTLGNLIFKDNDMKTKTPADEIQPVEALRSGRHRKLRMIDPSRVDEGEDYDNDDDEDNCEIIPLKSPQGHSFRFSYHPSDYIEYSIAIKSATDLCEGFDYFDAHSNTFNLQVDHDTQQVCSLTGTAVTKVGKSIVSVSTSFNSDNNRFTVIIHSYDKEAAREVTRQFRKLCRKGNFYKGKCLQANSLEREPLTFLQNPEKQTIYGFDKEYASIRMNSVGFFKMHDIHRLISSRGLIIGGSPGTGKSLITSQIQRECLENGITVINMSMAAMHSVGAWYDKIERWLSPALVVMEDIDIIGTTRELEKSVAPVTTDLLNSLSGSKKQKAVIVTLATTNRYDMLDSALVRSRRMDQKYTIEGLQPAFKKKLFRSYFEQFDINFTDDKLDEVTNILGEEATGADVSSISVSAMIHIKDGKSQSESIDLAIQEWKLSHRASPAKAGFFQG